MSTSKLQCYTSKQLYKRFGKYGLVENTHPDWLVSSKGERLELDFFIDKLSIAIEVQGRQHFEFVPAFHATHHDFKEQLRRDTEKKSICEEIGIALLYIESKSDVSVALYEICARVDSRLQNGQSMLERPSKDIWSINPLQEMLRSSRQNEKYHKKILRKMKRANQTVQEYFETLVHRLALSSSDTLSSVPSQSSKKRSRQKLKAINYIMETNQVIMTREQEETIIEAMNLV